MNDQVSSNRSAQRELYGEPLADVLGRVMVTFTLTQASLAGVLGVSAPMLSQLMSAHRVKIGNPAVVLRLQALQDLAERVEAGEVAAPEFPEALETVRASTGQWTRPESRVATPRDEEVVAAVRGLLRAVASGQQIEAAAAALCTGQPHLADLLRTYGLGPADAAVQHYRDRRPLM